MIEDASIDNAAGHVGTLVSSSSRVLSSLRDTLLVTSKAQEQTILTIALSTCRQLMAGRTVLAAM